MIDLKPFCGDESFRAYLNAPFSRGGYTWATNGHIMVRVPLRPEIPDNERAPEKVQSTWDSVVAMHATDKWTPIKAFTLPPAGRESCGCYDGKVHECPDCACECDNCDGTGTVSEVQYVTFRYAAMNGKYASAILALPSLEVSLPHDGHMLFRFDGGEGILMLIRGHSSDYDAIADLETGPKK